MTVVKAWAADNGVKIPSEALELAVLNTYQEGTSLGNGFIAAL